MTYANITNLLETKKFCSALVKAPLPCCCAHNEKNERQHRLCQRCPRGASVSQLLTFDTLFNFRVVLSYAKLIN